MNPPFFRRSGHVFFKLRLLGVCFLFLSSAFLALLTCNATPRATSTVAGNWFVVPSPDTDGVQNELHGVTCVDENDCWAVGVIWSGINSDNSPIKQTLVEHYNGSAWSIFPSSNTNSDTENYLSAVSCVSANDCWAAGYYIDGEYSQALFEHYDGTTWTIVAGQNGAPDTDTVLWGLTCIESNDCWAVGGAQGLTEHYDGTSWSIVTSAVPTSPNGQSSSYEFNGVTCADHNDCWASGWNHGNDITLTLIEHYDGTSWSVVNHPTPPPVDGRFMDLVGLTCVRSTNCWAVGWDQSTGAIIEQYNGNGWSMVNDPTGQFDVLKGIACSASDDCWAIGGYGSELTLAEHWDGNSWSIVSSPSPGYDHDLTALVCTSTSNCWTVGSYFNGGNFGALIEHYAPAEVRVTAAVSRKTHGAASDFDVDLPLTGNAGIECRSGGATGDHKLVLTFAAPITINGNPQAQVTTGIGEIGSGGVASGGGVSVDQTRTIVTVPLTNVANAQTIAVTLFNVSDGTNSSNVVVPMSVLIGDTNADRFVDAIDTAQTKSKSGQAVNTTNFREDVNTDGFLDAVDAAFVKSKSGTTLPGIMVSPSDPPAQTSPTRRSRERVPRK
jgi:hypothetical protein